MAEWKKNKVDPQDINNGQEYTKNDNVSLEELNSIVNNSLYASDISSEALNNSNKALSISQEALQTVVEQTGTKVYVGGELQQTFDADTKLTVTDGEVTVSKINLGSIILTQFTDEETGESGLRISLPDNNGGGE